MIQIKQHDCLKRFTYSLVVTLVRCEWVVSDSLESRWDMFQTSASCSLYTFRLCAINSIKLIMFCVFKP